jgi:hypothetical protein
VPGRLTGGAIDRFLRRPRPEGEAHVVAE